MPDQTDRLTFGVHTPLFPNAGIFVAHVPHSVANEAGYLISTVKTLLGPFIPDLEERLVCESVPD